MNNPIMEDVLELTKTIIHDYCNGKFENWFSHLSKESILIATGEGVLYGSKNIINHLKSYSKVERGEILDEEYLKIPIDNNAVVVHAGIATKLSVGSYRVVNSFTFIYKLMNNETKIIYEHVSYEYVSDDEDMESSFHSLNTSHLQFIKYLLMHKSSNERLCIINGNQTLFVDMNTILYIKGSGHNTDFHCINQTINSTKTLQELNQELPDNFYQIHRSYIINTKFLSSVSCYEAELLSGVKIPIPAANYGKVKNFLEEKLNRTLKKIK